MCGRVPEKRMYLHISVNEPVCDLIADCYVAVQYLPRKELCTVMLTYPTSPVFRLKHVPTQHVEIAEMVMLYKSGQQANKVKF